MESLPDQHPDEELLAALAMDDLEDLSLEQQAHVQSCPRCTAVVDELRRTALRVRASRRDEQGGPAPHVWAAVLQEVGDAHTPPPAAPASPAPPRHMSATPLAERRTRRSIPAPLVAAVVVLALALGVGVGALWGRGNQPPAATDDLLARAELSEVGGTDPRGMAEVVRRGNRVELRVQGSHLGTGDGVHEVWLLNRDRKRLVALGLLGAGQSGTFLMPARLLKEGYVLVDVSLEPDDGNPAHSGDSLARGQLRLS